MLTHRRKTHYAGPEYVPYRLAGQIHPHLTGFHDADNRAVVGAYFHSDQNRIAVYAQDWNHVGAFSEQNGMKYRYTLGFRPIIAAANDKTQKVMLSRRYLLEQRAKQAIATKQYVLSQSQLMQGNYKASNP